MEISRFMTPPYAAFDLFTLKNFRLESGAVLPEVHLAYSISGTSSTKPPILTCTSFGRGCDDLVYLYGKSLDPAQHWIIHTELLGNGRSSSPNNMSAPWARADFPAVTIRDNVALQHALLEYLNVHEIAAVVGASMGGQQAIQWAVSYPNQVQRAVVIVGSCRTTWHGQLFLNALSSCIRSDPAFKQGDYLEPPLEGIARLADTWAPWVFSPEFYAAEAYQTYEDTKADSLEEFLDKWRFRYFQRDANNMLSQFQTWANHDVATTPGMGDSLEKVLAQVEAEVLFLPSRTDAYFAVSDNQAEAALIPKAKVQVIDSISGHAAGLGRDPKDCQQINQAIADFL
jgi:homoserine O-acetyltransferase/O-succinyltransferase